MLELKDAQFFKSYHNSFSLIIDVFRNSPKESFNIWATFVRKFVTKNLQKSPNLVTLGSQFRRYEIHSYDV